MNKSTRIILVAVKAVAGSLAASLVIAEGHPYIAVGLMAVAAGASEVINYTNKSINKP
jgi:hypothetical protein